MPTKTKLSAIEATVGKVVGESLEIPKICHIIGMAARTSHPVLIIGEPGTGKEVIARAIHSTSARRHMPFVKLDCARLESGELEQQLLAFSQGCEQAMNFDGGTLFLDRINALNFDLQGALLHALQQVESSRDPLHRQQQARILATSARDLQLMVWEGNFRRDLYFRLSALTLRVPPLRERRSDIPLLTLSFLNQFSQGLDRDYQLSTEAMRAILSYEWPGNVRELERSLKLACSSAQRSMIGLPDLPRALREADEKETAEFSGVRVLALRSPAHPKLRKMLVELEYEPTERFLK